MTMLRKLLVFGLLLMLLAACASPTPDAGRVVVAPQPTRVVPEHLKTMPPVDSFLERLLLFFVAKPSEPTK